MSTSFVERDVAIRKPHPSRIRQGAGLTLLAATAIFGGKEAFDFGHNIRQDRIDALTACARGEGELERGEGLSDYLMVSCGGVVVAIGAENPVMLPGWQQRVENALHEERTHDLGQVGDGIGAFIAFEAALGAVSVGYVALREKA